MAVSLVIAPKIPQSFRIITNPFKNCLRAFQSPRGLDHTNHGGWPKAAPAHYCVSFPFGSERLSKDSQKVCTNPK